MKNESINQKEGILALKEEYFRKIGYLTERNKTVKAFSHLRNELSVNNELIESYKTVIVNLEELLK